MIDSPSREIGNSRDFGEVRAAVHRSVAAIDPRHDMGCIDQAFKLIEDACQGRLAGYATLLTPYHDQGHMLEVVLCSARLLHGLHLGGQPIDGPTIDACIVGALLHDSGYLMQDAEASGTGAQFTSSHVPRGVQFAEKHLTGILSPEVLAATGKVILATDHRPVAVMPVFDNPSQRLAAQVTATADLIGQMANREYLERLLLLYFEFREAGIDFFADIHDLLERTQDFHRLMAARLQGELGGLASHLTRHFDMTRGARRNYYLESVARNLDYLDILVRAERPRRLEMLKRGGIVERAQINLTAETHR
jgi:hypothetical protein